RAVIAALIAHERGLEFVAGLEATDFSDPFCRRAITSILALGEAGKPFDIIAVSQSGVSLARLGEVVQCPASLANLPYYVQEVKDASALRRLGQACQAAIASLDDRRPAGEILETASTAISGISNQIRRDATVRIGDLMLPWLDSLEARFESGKHINGLATGFADFDNATTGLYGGDLMILAGRPAMGKTALAMNVAERVADAGTPVQVFSLEMSRGQLIDRVISSLARVDLGAIRAPVRLEQEDFARIMAATARVRAMPLFVDDTPGISLTEFRARATKAKRTHGIGLIVVDYLQLMTARAESRVNEIGALSRGLKLVAKELDVPIIALSQLSREVEKRQSKRPQLSDLRDSGSIEQDADIVTFAYRDDYYREDSPNPGTAEWIIGKQRMGETKTLRLAFQGRFSRFESFVGQWAEEKRKPAYNPYGDD
ncbi:MAG: replicative DNA helicase, partial [Chloroflexi bacterium]|nr:replicative DNA helicase [Chloroflexota bacterium]